MDLIKVRELTVDDVFALVRMLGKITKGARDEIAAALSDGLEKTNPTQFALVLFQSLFIDAEEDLKTWMGALIGKKGTAFGSLPAITALDIVEQLVSQEGIKAFFVRASHLADKQSS